MNLGNKKPYPTPLNLNLSKFKLVIMLTLLKLLTLPVLNFIRANLKFIIIIYVNSYKTDKLTKPFINNLWLCNLNKGKNRILKKVQFHFKLNLIKIKINLLKKVI